jgi:hypothetical protein
VLSPTPSTGSLLLEIVSWTEPVYRCFFEVPSKGVFPTEEIAVPGYNCRTLDANDGKCAE